MPPHLSLNLIAQPSQAAPQSVIHWLASRPLISLDPSPPPLFRARSPIASSRLNPTRILKSDLAFWINLALF